MDFLENIFNSLSYPVVIIAPDYTIIRANNATSENFSIASENIVGQACYKVTHGLDKPCWQHEGIKCPAKEAFETKKRVKVFHNHLIDEKRHCVEQITATPITTDGNIQYVVEELRSMTKVFGLKDSVLPICSWCHLVRDADGNWINIEEYIMKYAGAHSSHSICPECSHSICPECI